MKVSELVAWLQAQPQEGSVHVRIGYDNWSGPEFAELVESMLDCYQPYNKDGSYAQITLGHG